MNHAALAITLTLAASCLSPGQMTIENPQRQSVPEDKAKIIMHIALHVVAEEYHQRSASEADFPLVLVLGQEHERYEENEGAGICKVYLKQWDERRFAIAFMVSGCSCPKHLSLIPRTLSSNFCASSHFPSYEYAVASSDIAINVSWVSPTSRISIISTAFAKSSRACA